MPIYFIIIYFILLDLVNVSQLHNIILLDIKTMNNCVKTNAF